MAVETPNEDNNNQSGNRQVPVQAGNPRFRPGLDPDPNPKVVVRAINPPITPDQVVSQAESPSATTLPDVKLEKIRIPRVQNKSIQGYLKAIEAKMTATEKLMKDVVKLQNLQIVTEKELHERKRELYQNTFEEYLLDKTVGFDDRDDPDCTCINIPKKPGGGFPFAGGRRRRRGGGGGGTPPPILPPVENETETENETGSDADEVLGTRDFGDNYAEKEREAFRKAEEFEKRKQQETKVAPKGKPVPDQDEAEAVPDTPMVPERAPLRVPPGLPVLDPKFVPPFIIPDVISQRGTPATPPVVTIPGYDMRVKTDQQALADAIGTYIENNPGSEFEIKLERGARTDTGHLIKREDGKLYIHEPLTQEQLILIQAGNILNPAGWMPIVPRGRTGGRRTGGGLPVYSSPSSLPPVRRAPIPVPPANTKVPTNRPSQPAPVPAATVRPKQSITGALDQRSGSIRSTAASFRAQSSAAQADFGRDLATDSLNQRALQRSFQQGNQPQGDQGGRRIRKVFQSNRQPGVSFETNMDVSDFVGGFGARPLTLKEQLMQMRQPSFDLYNSPIGPQPKASGGAGEMNLYDSKSKQYFRNISNNLSIPKFGGGGFMGWFNKGVNTRIPNEAAARFGNPLDYFKKNPDPTTLFGDDALQRGQSNKAFKAGKKPSLLGRPDRAFGLDLVDSVKQRRFVTVPASQGGPMSGPTPVTRELVKRPIRAARSAVKPGHPLVMLAELIINELVSPQSTAVYDQVTGPNAYYNDPAYKGPMPSQNLENAQSNMMTGNNDQKPEVVPLPPDYIKIPGKKKDKSEVGYDTPGIDIEASPFARRDTAYDPGFGAF